jgi:enhancer of mRNA-decapping protein 3
VPEFTINAAEIVELVEAVNENITAKVNIPTPVAAVPVAKPKAFEDPAILSVGRKPTPVTQTPIPGPQWGSASMERTESTRTARAKDDRALKDITPAATLVEPMQGLSVQEVEANGGAHGLILEELEAEAPISPEQPAAKAGRRPRRRKQGRRGADDSLQEPDVTPAKETTRSKGWRQTPLLEPNPSFQPFATLKRKNGRGREKIDENGWATEDATDVQEMGDFDFAGNMAKFDKNSVFTQIQAEDSIAEEDRLVSHNRLPKAKPGTAGGKNFHYTENVLDVPNGKASPKPKNDLWKSEAGESDVEERAERSSLRDTGSGRQSRRAESKLATNRRPPSRKGSSIASAQQPARSLSVSPSSYQTSLKSMTADFHQIPAPASKPSFFLVPSDRRCEPISALQMLNIENIADNELGLSEDMMTENAGRGIAEVAISAVSVGGHGLTQGKNSNIPTVVVFAGNNKSGLRAAAAGRHIQNHGVNVVICVLGIERESELLVGLRRQLKVFRSFGGKVVSKVELLEYVKTLETPIELIVDGLLGLTISFEELRTGDQATAYELIEWANRSKANVLAIDIPTGIEPTSGKVSIIDGRQLYIHAKFVVAIGAPKKGLLEAMALGEGVIDEDGVGKGKEWQLFVADIGLGAAVWKKAGTRVRRGVEFEGSWILAMRFQGGAE